jgi:hypothetical protein
MKMGTIAWSWRHDVASGFAKNRSDVADRSFSEALRRKVPDAGVQATSNAEWR